MPDPDEIPPAPSESAEADDTSKAETIRITLPAKTDVPTTKRETVRINLPGKGGPVPASPDATPKKETSKISLEGEEAQTTIAPAAPVASAKPFLPPPPRPPSQPGAPMPPVKPLSGVNPPPKPPSLNKPTVPLKPGPAPAPTGSGLKPASPSGIRSMPGAPSASGVSEPVTQRAASPKKETARITLPPEGTKTTMPKATVKMQQTQPLVRQPSASGIQTVPALQTSSSLAAASAPAGSDGLMTVLAVVAFLASIAAAALAFMAYSGSQVS